jgi:hypothetical protein
MASSIDNGDNIATEVNAIHNGALNKTDIDEPVAVGSIVAQKDLYATPPDEEGNFTWVDTYPKDVPEASENAETAKFAVIVRNIKSTDAKKTLEAHSIVVQSPWLKKALGEHVLKDYPGVTCELKRLEFDAPFKPFVHRWTEFMNYKNRTDLDETTRAHIDLLHDILDREIGELIKAHKDYVSTGVITFEHLWILFQPGHVIISESPLAAFELGSSEYVRSDGRLMLQLTCEYVNWSGTEFGRGSDEIDLKSFHGTKKIRHLEAFPLHFHERKDELKTLLIERGQKFESLAGHQYKAYSGMAVTWKPNGREQPIYATGRIVVDTDAFDRFGHLPMRYVEPFGPTDEEAVAKYREEKEQEQASDENGQSVNADDSATGARSSEASSKIWLTPQHHLICCPRVRGYSLKLKKWLDFWVDQVSDIEWDTKAFDSLVLPENTKDLILSFTESQVENKQSFDDVIQGKGKGIIILLSGSPGIGKTLTAEATAEALQVPLYALTSGDLGSTSYDVEHKLSTALYLVGQWNAILLLDECEVFLEARSNHDLHRNQIVSIFLRTLEYYEGIMFMTTNRVSNIDAAFNSRIHVSLEYPDLTPSSRRQIWVNMANTKEHNFSDTDFDELSMININGRQIKNILKMAQLLASRKKTVLDREAVEVVLAIEKRRPEMENNVPEVVASYTVL